MFRCKWLHSRQFWKKSFNKILLCLSTNFVLPNLIKLKFFLYNLQWRNNILIKYTVLYSILTLCFYVWCSIRPCTWSLLSGARRASWWPSTSRWRWPWWGRSPSTTPSASLGTCSRTTIRILVVGRLPQNCLQKYQQIICFTKLKLTCHLTNCFMTCLISI